MSSASRYYSNLPKTPRSRPSDGLPAAGVIADPAIPKSIVGVAYPTAHIGGCRPEDDPWTGYDPPEVVWRIVLDRAWHEGQVRWLSSKEPLDGRYVLRDGEFIELAEEAT